MVTAAKAFDALSAVQKVLGLIPGLAVEVIESVAAGWPAASAMTSHYDVSMRMAELSLLPAARAASLDTLLVADGTSCRHQIADGTRDTGTRAAVHCIRVVERALKNAPH
jgi:hypothetical protein